MGKKISATISTKQEDSPIIKRMDMSSEKSPGKTKSSRGGSRTAPTTKEGVQGRQAKNKSFPIVGIGASAGGLEAFTQLLGALPVDTGMAFVLIQHLDPKHESILTDILSRATKMPVIEVKDGMRVEPNRIYVIPPNTTMGISQGVLSLIPRPKTSMPHIPIDHFLRSLAEDQGSKSAGVILSGTGSDGAIGIEAIKAEGGITFAQDEKSAKYSGMPHSAIATGCVDFILPPEEIAKELARIGHHPYVVHPKPMETPSLTPEDSNGLNKIFILMRTATGVDFTHYKQATVKRRIMRRMALHRIEEMEDYVNYLKDNPSELEALYQDILIKVTRFFRDPESFEALKDQMLPSIVKNKSHEEPIRIWVPGCSTGEEVYSIAISLLEFLGNAAANIPVQIFATDISETVIAKARTGIYIENIAADVSHERLRRFFAKADQGYQINKTIRDMCVFAKHNLTKDPPFSNLDLISCRNVLIYLGPVLQKRVMPILHYALKPSGFLMLGNAETVGNFSEMFAPVDKKHKIYSKKVTSASPTFHFVSNYSVEKKPIIKKTDEKVRSEPDIQKEADHIILSEYAPASVLINGDMEILQFRGQTGPYLNPASGRASLNLLKMVQEGLLLDLRAAIQRAKKEGERVRKEGLKIKYNGEMRDVSIEVIPMKTSKERCFLVLFKEVTQTLIPELHKTKTKKAQPGKSRQEAENREITKLREELDATREHLQSTIIQEQEAFNEELKSANEEVLSSNEELQSINEELETAKEELQSANEELNTVNQELQNQNIELNQLSNDLNNVLSSANVPIIMLGNDLRIRRFTPMAEKVLNLIPSDIGRPVSNINLDINVSDLEQLVSDVIDTVSIKELEIQNAKGHWYYMQIRPYRTKENKIDGAVIVLVDIDLLKRSLEQAKESRDYAEAIVETVREPLIILDADLRVRTANQSFYETFQVSPEETEGRFIYELGNDQWNIPDLRTLLGEILPINTRFQGFEVNHEFPRIGHKTMLLNARRIHTKDNDTRMILLAIEDITERKRAEKVIQKAKDELEIRVQERTRELIKANEELQAEITERKRAEGMLSKHMQILDLANDAIIIRGLDDKITYWNQGAERLYGWTEEEAQGKHIHTLLESILPRSLEEIKDEFFRDGYWEGELIQTKHDGTQTTVWSHWTLQRDENGKPSAILAINNNITERKRMEEERLKFSKIESVGILAGGIAHDFNNLLTGIIAGISLTKMDAHPGTEMYENLTEVDKICVQAKGLTQQLLTFAKGGAPIKELASIEQIIRDTASFALRGSNVRSEISIEEELWYVEIDWGQIGQVISNLVINAQQAMPQGGVIKISAENDVGAGFKPAPTKESRYVKITVEDQGVGISQEHLSKVFDPYFTTKQKGSGLGLATAYSIIKNHNGFIDVESQLGKGTKLYVYIPASDKRVQEQRQEQRKALRGKGRVLIMDDEAIIRRSAGKALSRMGYEVEYASDGEEAIKLYIRAGGENRPFDLVIMDLTIPGRMGGREAIGKLIEIDPRVKAVVSSGYSNDPVMSDYKKYGFRGVVSKPYTIEDLAQTLHKVMGGK